MTVYVVLTDEGSIAFVTTNWIRAYDYERENDGAYFIECEVES